MKKYIALLTLTLTAVLPIQAQYLLSSEEHAELNAAVRRAVEQRDKIQATVTVNIPITKQYFTDQNDQIDFANSMQYRTSNQVPTYKSTVGCKAYALDDHWLIAGAVCLWNGRHHIHVDGKNYLTGLVSEDFSRQAQINNTSFPLEGHVFVQPRFTLLPHLLLVRVPENSELASTVKNMPKINILGLTTTSPMDLKGGSFHVNTSRFGWDAERFRSLQAFNKQTRVVTIREFFDDLASLSNDPLLYAFNGKIYWMGVNKGVMKTYPDFKWDGQPSKAFVVFNNSDLDFIKRTILEQDPAAWPGIAPRLHRDSVK